MNSRRLTDLLGLGVEDEDGRRLGHLHDLIAERRGDNAVIVALLVGSGGVLSRLGLPVGARHDRIGWDQVRRIDGHRVVIAKGALPGPD